jgi:hypothetical protein
MSKTVDALSQGIHHKKAQGTQRTVSPDTSSGPPKARAVGTSKISGSVSLRFSSRDAREKRLSRSTS